MDKHRKSLSKDDLSACSTVVAAHLRRIRESGVCGERYFKICVRVEHLQPERNRLVRPSVTIFEGKEGASVDTHADRGVPSKQRSSEAKDRNSEQDEKD